MERATLRAETAARCSTGRRIICVALREPKPCASICASSLSSSRQESERSRRNSALFSDSSGERMVQGGSDGRAATDLEVLVQEARRDALERGVDHEHAELPQAQEHGHALALEVRGHDGAIEAEQAVRACVRARLQRRI